MQHFLQFVDAILSAAEPVVNARRRWRWNKGVESTSEDRVILIKLIVRHIFRIFFTFNDGRYQRQPFDLFDRLLSEGEISNPSLRLVMMAFGGHQRMPGIPTESDSIWHDQVWGYAVSVWLGFHADHVTVGGQEISATTPLEVSTVVVARLRRLNPAAFDALVDHSTRCHSTLAVRLARTYRNITYLVYSSLPSSGLATFYQFMRLKLSGHLPNKW